MRSKQKAVVENLTQIDWNKLKVFYHIAQSKSLLEAASQMNYEQSGLTRLIQSLEKSLGYPVLIRKRSRDGVLLTQQGQVLMNAARNILTELTLAGAQIDERHKSPHGQLKISYLVGLFPYISSHIEAFLKAYPDIRLVFFETDLAPQLERLETDVLLHSYIKGRPDLIQEPMMELNFETYASPDYLEKFGTPKTVEDLDNHRLITSSIVRYVPDVVANSNWILSAGKQEGEIRVPYIEDNSMVSRLELARLGIGIASLPREMSGIKESNLVPILTNVTGPSVKIYYTYSEVVRHSKRVMVMRDFMLSIFQDK